MTLNDGNAFTVKYLYIVICVFIYSYRGRDVRCNVYLSYVTRHMCLATAIVAVMSGVMSTYCT